MKYIRRNLEALTIFFIIFKLLDLIQWSWWLVLAPTWVPIALILFLLLVKWVWWKFFLTEQERDAERISNLLQDMADHYKGH